MNCLRPIPVFRYHTRLSMGTRRDTALQAISDANDTIRASLSSPAPRGSQDQTRAASNGRRNSVTSTSSASQATMASRLQRGLSGISHAAQNLLEASANPNSGVVASTSREIMPEPNASPDGDALPDYSRRDPLITNSAVSMREHVYTRKLMELTIRGCGKDAPHPLFVQDIGNKISGTVTLRIPDKPELVSAIRIKLKCVLSTLVQRTAAPVTRPQAQGEELLIFSTEQTLWESSQADGQRMSGMHEYAYNLEIPKHIPNYSGANGQEVLMPPSYAVGVDSDTPVASVKYYLKATLARPGLFRSNDRLIAPIVYIQSSPAINTSHFVSSLKSGQLDPSEWEGQKQTTHISKGLFKKTQAFYEATALLPKPPKFDRYATVPVALKITSSDPSSTGKFTSSQITVTLIQRLAMSVAGRMCAFDLGVVMGKFIPTDGEDGAKEEGANGTVWAKRFHGLLAITTPISPTFLAPNVYVSYCVGIHISNPGGDMRLRLPLEIRAGEPKILRPSVSAPGQSTNPTTQSDYSLPPSYYDVTAEANVKN